MTTVTLVANDRDLSDFYGIVDSVKHLMSRGDKSTISDWTQMLSDWYRSQTSGYYILFTGDDVDILNRACRLYRQEHRSGTQSTLCGEILNVISGKAASASLENEDERYKREREMLDSRASDDIWDTGDEHSGWTVEENADGFSDDDDDIPY